MATCQLTWIEHHMKKRNEYYETQYGPRVSCNSLVYRKSPNNIAYALRRLLGVRKPLIPGLCGLLYANQAAYFSTPHIQNIFREYGHTLSHLTTEYSHALLEQEEHYADPHDKRAARINAFQQAYDQGLIQYHHSCQVGRSSSFVEMSLKIETAKDGKIPRGVVDIGLNASLIVFRMAHILKHAVADTTFQLPGMDVFFVPDSSYAALKAGFDRMWTPTAALTLLVFSDDVAMVHHDGAHTTYYDMDISSCDKSHSAALFNLLRVVTPEHMKQDMELALEQLRQPLRVRNPTCRQEYIELEPICEVLYSGSVLTTITNVIAVFTCAVAISALPAITVGSLEAACQTAGYIMTVTPHQKFQKVQFLKHSPVLDQDGVWQPALNLGVLLRAAGHVKGDLPGKGDLEARALAQHAAQLRCSYPNSHFPLIETARARFPSFNPENMRLARASAKSDPDGWPHLHFTDEAILERYDLTPSDAPGVRLFFEHATFENVVSTPDLSHILTIDYGMTSNNLLTPTVPYHITHTPPT